MEDPVKYNTGSMSAAEIAALRTFQERINEVGELDEPKTIIQKAKVIESWFEPCLSNHQYHYGTGLFPPEIESEKGTKRQLKDVLSAGKLKACTTPMNFVRALQNPTENSETLNNGSAFHSLILEPNMFEYRIFDDSKIIEQLTAEGFTNPKATKKYKEWFSQYLNSDGVIAEDVLRKEAFQTMWKLKKKIQSDKAVQQLFKGSTNEASIFVMLDTIKADGTNLSVKVRPDGLKVATDEDALYFDGVNAGDMIIISVKTTIDASPSGFLRQCMRLGYNITEAFYNDVIEAYAREIELIEPENRVHTIFLTVEEEKKLLTGQYMIRPCTDEFLKWGRREYNQNLEVYCNTTDWSTGYEAINGGSIICPIFADLATQRNYAKN